MNNFQIDRLAEKALASGRNTVTLPQNSDPCNLEQIRQRIVEMPFDCTPNWGIVGVTAEQNSIKRNWYLLDETVRSRTSERIRNVDFNILHKLVSVAVNDVLGAESKVLGLGLYGSYLYRESTCPPEDLDVLAIVGGVDGVVLDALRYRHASLYDAFRDRAMPIPQTRELGLTVISEEQFKPDNHSYVVTDAALLDVSTTFSYNAQIEAPPLSPFIIAHNALKVLRWGLSCLTDKPISTMSRIDEALRMRDMLKQDNPTLGLSEFDLEDYAPRATRLLLTGLGENDTLDLSKIIIRVIEDDERIIRERLAHDLRLSDE